MAHRNRNASGSVAAENGRAKRGGATPEALLDAAEALFSARGYAAVGIREIAEAASVNLAAISYHFGSKRELYLETVKRAMKRGGGARAWDGLRSGLRVGSPPDAALAIARFIHDFLLFLIDASEKRPVCGLLLREAASPSEAFDAVIADFILPNHELLREAVGAVAPSLADSERSLHAMSILGQILHYQVFRSFVEQLESGRLERLEDRSRIAAHITRCALRGLGCDETLIEECVRQALVRSTAPPTQASIQESHIGEETQ